MGRVELAVPFPWEPIKGLANRSRTPQIISKDKCGTAETMETWTEEEWLEAEEGLTEAQLGKSEKRK